MLLAIYYMTTSKSLQVYTLHLITIDNNNIYNIYLLNAYTQTQIMNLIDNKFRAIIGYKANIL